MADVLMHGTVFDVSALIWARNRKEVHDEVMVLVAG